MGYDKHIKVCPDKCKCEWAEDMGCGVYCQFYPPPKEEEPTMENMILTVTTDKGVQSTITKNEDKLTMSVDLSPEE